MKLKPSEREQRLLHLDVAKVEDMPIEESVKKSQSKKQSVIAKQTKRGQWKKDRADRGVLLRGRVWYARYKDVNGKTHWEAVGPSKAVALKVYKKRVTEVAEGRFFPEIARRNVTFEQMIDEAREATVRAHTLKYQGRRRFRDYRWGIIREWFKDRAAASISPQEIDAHLNSHCKSAATRNQYRCAISHAYRLAIDNKKIVENPATIVKLVRVNNEHVRFLNQYAPSPVKDEQLKKLNDEESRLRFIMRRRFPQREAEFDLALNTGLRYSEQYDAHWRDVDLARKIFTISFAKSGKREYVPLNRSALAALAQLRSRFPADANVENERVCASTRWEHRQWWYVVKQEAGVHDFRWHDLRHTFASRLVMADVNILTVKELMRHANLAMNLRYAHLAPSHLHEAVEKLSVATSVAALSEHAETRSRHVN